MPVFFKTLLGLVCALILAAACTAQPTPTPALTQTPVPTIALPSPSPSATNTLVPTAIPATATASATLTPQLVVITLITPTPLPTQPPTATPEPPTPTLLPGQNAPSSEPTRVPRPSELGDSAGDAALVGVLGRCWNVSDTQQLNGNNPAHRQAFECARGLLLGIVRDYPAYPLVHRVLAWGYFYRDNDTGKAITEYRAAANLYKQVGNQTGESEARMRLALLVISSNINQGCSELALAGNLDPANDRAITYYDAFGCRNAARSSGSAPPLAPQVDLAALKGKIVYKSEREDGTFGYYVMDPDGKNVKRITGSAYNAAAQWESWSPDRQQVATVRNAGFTAKYGYDNDIWITDPSGGTGRPLTNPANDYDPAWSPVGLFDGRTWIAFVSNRGDARHPDAKGEEIWIMHDDSTDPLRLTCHGPEYSKHPTWSPDATRLAFHSNYRHGDKAQIYIMSVQELGNTADPCTLGDGIVNISNSDSNDTEPIWVK